MLHVWDCIWVITNYTIILSIKIIFLQRSEALRHTNFKIKTLWDSCLTFKTHFKPTSHRYCNSIQDNSDYF